ncbi:MAG: hypothetical protein J5501_02910 [Ruminococcus sp.]|nr:hypothetical protein [Ruminococcus sp.]
MKKTFIILAAGIILSGCGVIETSENDIPEVTEPASAAETTETTTETTTTTTTAETLAVVTTAAPTEEATIDWEEYESELYTRHEEKIPPEERAALDKLRAKYGKDFTFVSRELPWEFFGGIPEKKPATYVLMDDEGRYFAAFGTEDSEELTGEEYAYLFHEDEFFDRTKEYIRSYTQAGKLWILTPYKKSVPLEAPADLTYDQFLTYFCDRGYRVYANILIPEGTELPEEFVSDEFMNRIHLDGLSYDVDLGVYYLPQKDYDVLDDVTYGDVDIDKNHLRAPNE